MAKSFYPIQLVMYLGNDFVASVRVNAHQITKPGYMGHLKRQLIEQNSELLKNSSEKPEFLVVDLFQTKNDRQG